MKNYLILLRIYKNNITMGLLFVTSYLVFYMMNEKLIMKILLKFLYERLYFW